MKHFYKGKKILVLGGTGTLGQRIIRSLADYEPEVIRIFSRDEHKQFLMESEFSDPELFRFLIGDVRDYDRVQRAAEDVDVIFHAAAMKHVPSCEYNPFEAVKTNVLGTENVIRAAIANKVDRVVFASSDKAISPTNAMGATKLLAERLVSAAQHSRGSAKTVFTSVRFGNVLGSRGSVINLFKQQIAERRRITLTDATMTRFMMTQKQAVDLMLEAGAISNGGEVFVLKMPVIRLLDLAEVVIEGACHAMGVPTESIEIDEIGPRPGEKMYEELMTEEEYKGSLDLGSMYAVLPQYAARSRYTYALPILEKEHAIHSHHVEPVTKEQLRAMLIQESLL